MIGDVPWIEKGWDKCEMRGINTEEEEIGGGKTRKSEETVTQC